MWLQLQKCLPILDLLQRLVHPKLMFASLGLAWPRAVPQHAHGLLKLGYGAVLK